MTVFLVFVIGVTVSFACFFLIRALTGFTPAFDRRTIEEIGLPGAFLTYCCAGPVLLVAGMEHGAGVSIRNTLLLTALFLAWTGALGVVSVESARGLLS